MFVHFPLESKEVLSEEDDCGNSCVIGSEIYLDVSYLHYLYDAQNSISHCMRACRVWSAPYDGENPPPEEYQHSNLEEAGRTRPPVTSKKTPNQMHRSGPPLKDLTATPGLLELEWDDSYDACPTQLQPEEDQETRPIPDEPPKHIQELRRTAIMIVKGSYIEESEFQNDVMVYDLVAQKDAHDSGNSYHASSKPTEAAKQEVLDGPVTDQKTTNSESSMSNGLSSPLDEMDSKKRGSQSDHKSLEGEDLMAQYEELIRTLGAQHSPAKTDSELKSPTHLMDEEEDEIDFNSFSPETPEAEKLPSPFGTKPRSGSRGHAVPFTGQKTFYFSKLFKFLHIILHTLIYILHYLKGQPFVVMTKSIGYIMHAFNTIMHLNNECALVYTACSLKKVYKTLSCMV